jgi:sec-independent protein translocase protein TatC
LLRAFKALFLVLALGFVLDGLGYWADRPWLGLGRPAVGIITASVREQLRNFYDRRKERLVSEAAAGKAEATAATAPRRLRLQLDAEAVAALRGVGPAEAAPAQIDVTVNPLDVFNSAESVVDFVRPRELTTLSVQESMVVYIKVSLLVSLIVASPYVFYQIWAFIAAGLYPHEKHYVHKYLPMSLGLFLAGVFLCQFAVIPKSIEALLWFNEWMGMTPDLRLSEWLGFAILMPLVFGVSFQTPLVMLFLERIGVMTVDAYVSGWRVAAMVLAVFAAMITPSVDALSMLFMWVPLVALYFLGIFLCRWSQAKDEPDDAPGDADLLVES